MGRAGGGAEKEKFLNRLTKKPINGNESNEGKEHSENPAGIPGGE